MEEFIEIPYPNFKISEYINRKAKDYCTFYLRDGFSRDPKSDIKRIDDTLYSLTKEEDKIQYIAYIINHVTQGLKKHIDKCTNETCKAEPMTQDLLYYLYGQLDYNGLQTDVGGFSQEEMYRNNNVLDELIISLKELKAGQEIIFSELDIRLVDTAIVDLEDAKGLQVLGKSKWFKLIGGTVLEFAGNKLLEGFFKHTFMPLIAKFGYVVKFLS